VSYGGAPLIEHIEVVPIFYGPAWATATGQDRVEMVETYLQFLTASSSPLIQFLSKYDVTPSTPGNIAAGNQTYTIGAGSVAPADIVRTHDLRNHAIRSATESATTVTIQTSSPTGFIDGQTVTISGVSVGGYDTTARITWVNATTFTYKLKQPGLAAGTGGLATGILDDKYAHSTLQAVISDEIALKHVPAPNANTVYFIVPDRSVVDVLDYGYHSGFTGSQGQNILYAYISDSYLPLGTLGDYGSRIGSAQTPINAFQTMTEVFYHELAEAITDPISYPTTSWVDHHPANKKYTEIGDLGILPPGDKKSPPDGYILLNDYVVAKLWDYQAANGKGASVLPNGTEVNSTPVTTLSTTTGPTLIGPSGRVTEKEPSFHWQAIAGANWYDLELEDVTTGKVVTRIANLNTTTYTATVPLKAGHTFRWMVRAYSNDGVMGQWGKVNRFTISS
jgi:hypothetical protein